MKIKKIKNFIKTATDEECLTAFVEFLNTRVSLANEFIKDDDGRVIKQVLVGMCGDSVFSSKPKDMPWPMVPVTTEEIVGKENIN